MSSVFVARIAVAIIVFIYSAYSAAVFAVESNDANDIGHVGSAVTNGQFHAVTSTPLVFNVSDLRLNEYLAIYPSPEITEISYEWDQVQSYISKTSPVAEMAKDKPSYWFAGSSIKNISANSDVVLVIHGSIIDVIEVHLYRNGRLEAYQATGYVYHRKELAYALNLEMKPGETYDIVLSFQSRYLTGPVHITLKDPEEFYRADYFERAVVFLCIGALVVLGLYNFVLFLGVREVSYLYYSLYLFSGIIGWAAIFNVLVYFFDVYSLGWNLVPFYLAPVFNSLFLLSFLRITRTSHPIIFYLVSGLMVVNIIWVISFAFISDYLTYYSMIIYNSTLWLALSLWAGILRLKEGYKPARFFVLGFTVFAIGGSVSILPGLGIKAPVENFYIVSLIAQTIDMTLLALALADKISLMRVEKEEAQQLAHNKNLQMLDIEKESNFKLQESNEKLQQAVKLYEDTDRKRKNFLLLANHELRTPVNALLDSVTILHDRQTKSGGESEKEIDNIKYGAESLSVLLDELSIFLELSNQHVEPVPSRVNLHSFFDKLVSIGETLSTGKNIVIEQEGYADSDIYADNFLLEVAIKPVLDNACKFTESGMVKIGFNYDKDDELLTLTIDDTGKGIDEDSVHRLLSAFEQTSEGFDREEGGLGLGLFITSTAVRTLGGRCGIHKSEELGGTQVKLVIPCEPLEQVEQLKGTISSALVVEDNPINAKVLSAILESMSVTTAIAEDGQLAIEAAEKSQFDVVFMDLQMPVMDGFQATEYLRSKAYPAPILAVTANSEQEARHKCLELGMADVLIKPVRNQDIKDAIARLGGKLPE